MTTQPEERDLAGEATEMEAYRRRLRADISPEEANEEMAEWEARNEYIAGYDGDDPLCTCSVEHSIEELDTNQCDCCGKDIV